ncbi:MAG: hypothetical protein FWG53_03530, partial [Clostridiales bacterium]|nr:hypothetical protein [Clostridiales bacterium]
NTKPDGSGTSYENGEEIVVDEDITLYAQWEPLKGTFELKKVVVDGETAFAITAWLDANGHDVDSILKDISFALYNSDKFGNMGSKAADGSLSGSMITFSPEVGAGWYLVHEEMGALASAVFGPADDLLVYFNGKAVTGNSSDFDYSVLYTLGYNTSSIINLGYPGLNQNGEVFPIWAVNTESGQTYASFCANAGSIRFAGDNGLGCKGYMVAEKFEVKTDYLDFLAAYNYIEDNMGSLNDNRAVTQVVTWALLGAIDIEGAHFADMEAGKVNKNAVVDVLTNYKGYVGNGMIVDLVYMVCENREHDYLYCQPQLVPVYSGEPSFSNYPTVANSTLSITAEVNAYKDVYEWVPGTKTIKDTLVTFIGKNGNNGNYMDDRGFTAVAVDVATGGTFEIAFSGNGSPKAQGDSQKTGVFYTVKVVGGKIVVTFDESYVSSSVTVKAYADMPVGKIDNSGHKADKSGTIVLDMPKNAAGTVYLALHMESLTYSCDSTGSFAFVESMEVPYEGTLALTVAGPDGYAYAANGFAGSLVLDSLMPGEYFVTLSGDGFENQTKSVTVEQDGTAAIEFNITVQYPNV